MRIGLFTDSFYPNVSGVATSVKNLHEGLNSLGHETYVIAGAMNLYQRDCVDRIIKVPSIYFPLWNTNMVNFTDSKSLEFLSSFHFDIIHTHTELTMGILANKLAQKYGIPHVHTAHTFYKYYYHYAMGNIFRLGEHTENWMVKHFCTHGVDELIVPSKEVENDLRTRHGLKRRFNIVKTGIDIEKFSDSKTLTKNEIRNKIGLSNDDFVLLYTGRLATEKNITDLLYGQVLLNSMYPNIKLVIVGSGNLNSSLKRMASKLDLKNSVVFTGEIPNKEMSNIYSMCDVFVMPSQSETQGLNVLEAVATGKPIVCHCSPVYEDVVCSGINGFYFNDVEDYVDSVIELYNNPDILQRFGQESLLMSGNFSKENYAKNIETVYKKVYTSN